MTYYVELDISHEASFEDVMQFAQEHMCEAELIEEFGPAGGNPLYKFKSSSYDCILELAMQILEDEEFASQQIGIV